MDTSGKGGVIRHAIGMVDPQGVTIKAFKAPTEEERAHPFLWRIERAAAGAGHDRDLRPLALRGRADRPGAPAGRGSRSGAQRYDEINAWEQRLVAEGTVLIKCFLHISADEQKERLLARLDDPTKHWKYNPGDVDERAKWPAYQEAYAGGAGALQHPARAVVRRSVRPQVVSQLGRRAAPGRAPARPEPAVAGRRLRRRGGEGRGLAESDASADRLSRASA